MARVQTNREAVRELSCYDGPNHTPVCNACDHPLPSHDPACPVHVAAQTLGGFGEQPCSIPLDPVCPECKGTLEVVLFTSTEPCSRCV